MGCNFRVIIFFRCTLTKQINEAISLAKKLNKKILFDIDDLVFDQKYINKNPYLQTISAYERKNYRENANLIGKILLLCQGVITSIEILGKELKNYVPEIFINHNVASEEMWKLSENALGKKSKIKNSKELIIGYFNNSISNYLDIKMIIPYLTKIVLEFKNVKLLLLGK